MTKRDDVWPAPWANNLWEKLREQWHEEMRQRERVFLRAMYPEGALVISAPSGEERKHELSPKAQAYCDALEEGLWQSWLERERR